MTQEFFKFKYISKHADLKIRGNINRRVCAPYALDKARQFGFDQAFLEACL